MNKFILYRYLESFNSRSLLLDPDYLNFDIVDPSLFPITNSNKGLKSREHIENVISKLDQEKIYVRNLDKLIPDSGYVIPVFLNIDTEKKELKEIRICSTANFTTVEEDYSENQEENIYKSVYDGSDPYIDETNYKKRKYSIDNNKQELITTFESKSGNIAFSQLDFSYLAFEEIGEEISIKLEEDLKHSHFYTDDTLDYLIKNNINALIPMVIRSGFTIKWKPGKYRVDFVKLVDTLFQSRPYCYSIRHIEDKSEINFMSDKN